MALLDSILTLLAQTEGGAVLLHANNPPVMLTESGQSPMPLPPLESAQMRDIVATLVPASLDPQLEQDGSVQFVTPAQGTRPAIAVTAIGRGEDAWLELRPAPAPEPVAAPPVRATLVPAAAKRLATVNDVNALIARAAARGDAALFLRSDAVPALKVDGTVEWLDDYQTVAAGDLQRLIGELAVDAAPATGDGVLRWNIEDAAVVECRVTTSDDRAEVALMITSAQPVAVERLGLPPAVSGICCDDFGLVVVAGSDARQVSRTCHSLVDLVNRERAHHIIVLESQSVTSHPRRRGYLSRRVIAGDQDAWLRAIERAVSEEPDVLMIDHVPSGATGWRAIELLLARAADALVIVQSGASSAIAALEGLVAGADASSRPAALGRVSGVLTAAIGQREIKCRGGGAAVSAYEVIVGTPAARDFVAEGAFANLALTLERGVDGMISMAAAVIGLMRDGRITARQAGIAVPGLAVAPPIARRRDASAVASAVNTPLVPVGDPVDLSEMLASIAQAEG